MRQSMLQFYKAIYAEGNHGYIIQQTVETADRQENEPV